MKEKAKTTAIVPGSFDPITYGHLDIVRRASEMYDKVYVAVMINREKSYMFNIEQRLSIARAAVGDDINIEVISSEGMLWELARDLSADAIVKGYRNEKDLEYERVMAKFNEEHYPAAKTVLLKADESLTELSSTVVRGELTAGRDISRFLPAAAEKEINNIIKKF